LLNIGIIGPEKSINNIKKIIKDLDLDFTISTYIYSSLSEIIKIYKNNVNEWDYLLLSGKLLYVYLNHNLKKIDVPNSYINLDNSYIYGKIINYLLENPSKNLSRVYFDFSGEMNNFIDLNKFIKPEQMPYNNSFLSLNNNQYSEIDLKHIHQKTIEEIKDLWNKNKIDYVFSRMPKVSKSLEQSAIPHKIILPPDENIIGALKNIKNEIEISKLKDNQNVIAFIDLNFDYQNEITHENNEYKEITMYKLLVDFRKEKNKKLSIIQTNNGFKLNFSKELIKNDNFKYELVDYIIKNYNYSFNMGISYTSIIEEGFFYALKAVNESKKFGDKNAFIVYKNYNAIGPLTKNVCLKYKISNDILNHYAEKMSISNFNLSRIISLSLSNIELINSNMIKKYCNITRRSANRILKKLEKNNIVEFIEKKKLKKSKGRPTKIYKINKNHRIYLSLINNLN